MEQPRRPPPEYTLEIFADLGSVKDVVKGVLHTIFFHRYFPTLRPSTLDIFDLTLPYVADAELESLIDTRVYQLARQLSSSTTPNNSVRGQLGVHFFEKRRRKAGAASTTSASSATSGGGGGGGGGAVVGGVAGALNWFGAAARGLQQQAQGHLGHQNQSQNQQQEEEVCWEKWRLEVTLATPRTEAEQRKVVRAMETTLARTAMKIVAIVNQHKEQIPPITTSEANPFPYQIVLNPKIDWGRQAGMH